MEFEGEEERIVGLAGVVMGGGVGAGCEKGSAKGAAPVGKGMVGVDVAALVEEAPGNVCDELGGFGKRS